MYYTFYCIFFRILTEKLTIEETLFGQEIFCNDLATFKFLRTYCSMITQKKIAIQSTTKYFKNENIPDDVKEIQGINLVIRGEFLELLKNFTHYIEAKLTSLDGQHYLCSDKKIEAVHEEVAQFLHAELFHNKLLIRYVPSEDVNDQSSVSQTEGPIIMPTADTIYRELKHQQKKSVYNSRSYHNKKVVGKQSDAVTSKKSSHGDAGGDQQEERYSDGDDEKNMA
jgi:hypothetical protein